MRVYLASPLGFTDYGLHHSRTVLLPAVRAVGLEPLDPWDDTQPAVRLLVAALTLPPGDARTTALRTANEAVGAQNADLIDAADGLLANLDGTDVDSGTAAEIGWAAARGIPVVGHRGDLRRTGDNDATVVNLQIEHFIRRTGGDVHRDLEPAIAQLAALVADRR